MSRPTTAQFLETLQRLPLLAPEQLQELAVHLQQHSAELETVTNGLVARGWLTGYQVERLLAARGPELVLGSYVLAEPLGRGGMGEVFKARHLHLDRVVALKIIRKEVLEHPEAVQRFRREARLAARLCHPHIVLIHDADQVDGTHFYVMEYVVGETLGQMVRARGALAVALACEYVRQACLGLQHVYERGLVHRDLKPSNLIFAARERVVEILDLGLAFVPDAEDLSGGTALTAPFMTLGTADYMAPEQARDAHGVDIRADIYSLGCTLYCLLTGGPPFPGDSVAEKARRHQQEDPTPLAELRPGLPAGLGDVLARMMAKAADRRYQTPAEVASALEPFAREELENTRSQPRPDLPPAASVPVRPRRRRAPWVAALLAFAGLAALLWMVFPTEGPKVVAGQWLVTRRTAAVPNACATIRQAIDKARPGDRILVQDDEHEEQLDLRPGEAPANLTLEAAAPSGRPVVWRLPVRGDATAPLCRLHKVEGFCLKGFVLDGGNRAGELVALVGDCPGLRLEDLHLTGFKRCGVRFENCAGTEGRPLALRRLRIATALPAEAALLFAAAPGAVPRIIRHVAVSDCRFEGPYRACVALEAAVADVQFRHNRFFKAHDGFLYRSQRIDPRLRVDLAATSNTFCDLDGAAFRFEELALAARTSRVEVTDNLFARTKTLAEAAAPQPVPARDTSWIWHPADDPLKAPLPGARRFSAILSEASLKLTRASWHIWCDDRFRAWCNGTLVASSQPGQRYYEVDVLAQVATNPRKLPDVFVVWCANEDGRAGLLAELFCRYGLKDQLRLRSQANWNASRAGPSVGELPPPPGGPVGDAQAVRVVPLRVTDAIGNVCDRANQEGNVDLKARTLPVALLSVDPDCEPAFLRYSPTSALMHAGHEKKPVGVPPSGR